MSKIKCTGNNGNGCFLDSCGHNCGCEGLKEFGEKIKMKREYIFDERTVIVLDNSNYKSSYAEKVPFKAIVKDIYDNEIVVISTVTGKEYELYYNQILETMDIEEIRFMLGGGEYGDFRAKKNKL